MPNEKTTLQIRIDNELKEQLEAAAARKGEAMSVLIREALREYLKSLDE